VERDDKRLDGRSGKVYGGEEEGIGMAKTGIWQGYGWDWKSWPWIVDRQEMRIR